MARTKGPLFSMEASGQIGKAIVYSEWKGRTYARGYIIPKNNHRPNQERIRTGWAIAVTKWQSLTTEVKLAWTTFANQFQMSGFNVFLQHLIREINIQLDPEEIPASVTVTGNPPVDVIVWTPEA